MSGDETTIDLPKRARRAFSCLFCSLGLAVFPTAQAHHSFAAYDGTHTRTLTGTVESFQWSNPHVVLKVLVTGGDGGQPQEWNIVTSSPAILARFGWSHDSLAAGEWISAVLNPMSDGSYAGRLHTLTVLGTGRTLETKLSAADKPPSH